jgi:hypothetical protein
MARDIYEERSEYAAKRAALRMSGTLVWCSWSAQPAAAPDGFCEFCGSTTHTAYGEQRDAR